MSGNFQNLPPALQVVIQEGWLERKIRAALKNKFAYRANVEKESFPTRIGEGFKRHRTAMLPAIVATLTPSDMSNAASLTNGQTAQTAPGYEQWEVTLRERGTFLGLNRKQDKVSLVNNYLRNAGLLADQSAKSREHLSRNELFAAGMSGDTYVVAALGAGSTTTAFVNDGRGFDKVMIADGTLADVSVSNPLTCSATAPDGTVTALSVTGCAFEVTNHSSASQVSSDGVEQCGRSATLTFAALGGALVDGTVIKAVHGSTVLRAKGRTRTSALLGGDMFTLSLLMDAKMALENNGVTGMDCVLGPASLRQLYADPEFQNLHTGGRSHTEMTTGQISDILGINFRLTTEAFQQAKFSSTGAHNVAVPVHRPILIGEGCLVESTFEADYEEEGQTIHNIVNVDGVNFIDRPAIDVFGQNVTQAWEWTGCYSAPQDQKTTPAVMPSASYARYKRQVVIEHAG